MGNMKLALLISLVSLSAVLFDKIVNYLYPPEADIAITNTPFTANLFQNSPHLTIVNTGQKAGFAPEFISVFFRLESSDDKWVELGITANIKENSLSIAPSQTIKVEYEISHVSFRYDSFSGFRFNPNDQPGKYSWVRDFTSAIEELNRVNSNYQIYSVAECGVESKYTNFKGEWVSTPNFFCDEENVSDNSLRLLFFIKDRIDKFSSGT